MEKNENVYNPLNGIYIIPFDGPWVSKLMIDGSGLSEIEKEMIDCLFVVFFSVNKKLFQLKIFM